jgi:hypothetical protein
MILILLFYLEKTAAAPPKEDPSHNILTIKHSCSPASKESVEGFVEQFGNLFLFFFSFHVMSSFDVHCMTRIKSKRDSEDGMRGEEGREGG